MRRILVIAIIFFSPFAYAKCTYDSAPEIINFPDDDSKFICAARIRCGDKLNEVYCFALRGKVCPSVNNCHKSKLARFSLLSPPVLKP